MPWANLFARVVQRHVPHGRAFARPWHPSVPISTTCNIAIQGQAQAIAIKEMVSKRASQLDIIMNTHLCDPSGLWPAKCDIACDALASSKMLFHISLRRTADPPMRFRRESYQPPASFASYHVVSFAGDE